MSKVNFSFFDKQSLTNKLGYVYNVPETVKVENLIQIITDIFSSDIEGEVSQLDYELTDNEIDFDINYEQLNIPVEIKDETSVEPTQPAV